MEAKLRYRDTGRLHLEFYRTLNATIAWLRENYGLEFLDETFRRTARGVYRSIARDLAGGDRRQLVAHWRHYLDREGGDYEITESDDCVRLEIRRCPAVAWLAEQGIPVDPHFCRQTVVVNRTLAEGTPFRIDTEPLGRGRCIQAIRRRR